MSEIHDIQLHMLSRLIALELWRTQAIRVRVAEPFRLASGNLSPLYVDCRRLLSSLPFIDLFSATSRILAATHHLQVDVVAGGETAGIPFAAFLARAFSLPMVYVRKQAKAHGTVSQLEGVLESGSRVILVEDLITDGASKLAFVDGIRAAGARVENSIVVFDRLQGGRASLRAHHVQLYSLTDIQVAIEVGLQHHLLKAQDAAAVRTYLDSPASWHTSRGFNYIAPTASR